MLIEIYVDDALDRRIRCINNRKIVTRWHPHGQIRSLSYFEDNKKHRANAPAVHKWDEVGNLWWRAYWSHGYIHRENSIAIEEWHETPGGFEYTASYFFKGRCHRDRGPALTTYNLITGRQIGVCYMKKGLKHRIDGPAVLAWDAETGRLIKRQYWIKGRCHRDQHLGPACESWYPDGTPQERSYLMHDLIHRAGKSHLDDKSYQDKILDPAVETWYQDGHIATRTYAIDGKKHRLDGPAFEKWIVVPRVPSGYRVLREYWIDGNKIRKTYE